VTLANLAPLFLLLISMLICFVPVLRGGAGL